MEAEVLFTQTETPLSVEVGSTSDTAEVTLEPMSIADSYLANDTQITTSTSVGSAVIDDAYTFTEQVIHASITLSVSDTEEAIGSHEVTQNATIQIGIDGIAGGGGVIGDGKIVRMTYDEFRALDVRNPKNIYLVTVGSKLERIYAGSQLICQKSTEQTMVFPFVFPLILQ